MRDDIVGMLRNAIEHGGNPTRVAQSLINSGYPPHEVQQALSYVTSMNAQTQGSVQGNPNSPLTPRSVISNSMQWPHSPYPAHPAPQASLITKPLPSIKPGPVDNGKLILMIAVLLALVTSLISVIIFKNKIFNWIG